jgi:hypothetical protein
LYWYSNDVKQTLLYGSPDSPLSAVSAYETEPLFVYSDTPDTPKLVVKLNANDKELISYKFQNKDINEFSEIGCVLSQISPLRSMSS